MIDLILKKCEKCESVIKEEKLENYLQINVYMYGNWIEHCRYKVTEESAAYMKYHELEKRYGDKATVELILVSTTVVISTEDK